MIRLIGFELRKALQNRFFWILAIAMLGITVLNVWKPWNGLPLEAHRAFRIADGQNLVFFRNVLDLSAEDHAALFEMGRNNVFGGNIVSPEEQVKPGIFTETWQTDYYMSRTYFSRQTRYDKAMQLREGIVQTAQRHGAKAAADGDAYQMRRNYEIIQIFSEKPVQAWLPMRGAEEYFADGLYDILALILAAGLASTCFSNEHETGAIQLVLAGRNGRRKTAAAKVLASMAAAVAISCLFSCAAFICYEIKSGILWAFPAPLIMLEGYHSAPFNGTIGQYTAIFIAFKAFGAMTLAGIVCMISALSRSNLKAYIAAAVYLGASFAYGILVRRPGWPEALHLPNITLWLHPYDYFAKYNAANLWQFPVGWWLVHIAFAVILLCAAAVVTISAHAHKRGRL